jgi:hypothetical protein
MKNKSVLFTLTVTCLNFINCTPQENKLEERPNLIIIHTDEHNFRTLGCYRETLSDDQALIWGKEAIVETPHIDRLAVEGVLCPTGMQHLPFVHHRGHQW